MAIICKSPLSKLLHTGADLLLRTVFGGRLEGRKGQERGTKGVNSVDVQCESLTEQFIFLAAGKGGASLLGSRPLTDKDLGLMSASKCQRTQSASKAWAMGEFAKAEEVIKEDTQKADNAVVLDHLWLRAFVLGYGTGGCSARPLEALNLMKGTVGFLDGPNLPIGWQGALPGL